MARNTFFVTNQEVYNLLEGISAPEAEMYTHLNTTFAAMAKRNGTPNTFTSNLRTWRSAFHNVVGIERERIMWATFLDVCGKRLCGRCGGAGGASQWPGYTCFECGGKGWTEKAQELQVD